MCSPEADDAAGEDADGEWCGAGVHVCVNAEGNEKKAPLRELVD